VQRQGGRIGRQHLQAYMIGADVAADDVIQLVAAPT
jgi:hypothetical protein